MVGVAQHAVGPIDVRDVRVALRVKVDIGVKPGHGGALVDGLHRPCFTGFCDVLQASCGVRTVVGAYVGSS